MANQEIHNYINEQTTPNSTDYMDLDADEGGGNFLSKKMTLSNLRKWLFKLVSQDQRELGIGNGQNAVITANTWNTFVFNVTNNTSFQISVSGTPYDDTATYVAHIHNNSGVAITLDPIFETTADNPDITTTIGGYSQVWVTYHTSGGTPYWTANTINFI